VSHRTECSFSESKGYSDFSSLLGKISSSKQKASGTWTGRCLWCLQTSSAYMVWQAWCWKRIWLLRRKEDLVKEFREFLRENEAVWQGVWHW